MRLRLLSTLTVLLALAAIVGLPLLGWHEAGRQAYASAAEVASGYARDILYRADKTTGQAASATLRLQRAGFAPCSPEEQALMGQLDVASSYIQAVGRLRAGVVQCASVGGMPPTLGTQVVPLPSGVVMYLDVAIGTGNDLSAIALQSGDFFVLVHRQLALDTWTGARKVDLGVFQIDRPAGAAAEISRGMVERAWLARLEGKSETTFIEGTRLVAVQRSSQFRIASVAALPISDLTARRDAIAIRLVPAGFLVGLVLAFAILSLARRQNSLTTSLRQGLRRHEFFMQYQPIIELASGRCIGVEALMRWRRATGELIGPDLFIPVAEQSGQITRLTARVLDLVRADTGAWLALNPDFHIAINLSPTDLLSADLPAMLDRFMAESGAQPRNLLLEITERGLVDVDAARPVLRALHERGYEMAIDDFGTGYSSLSYLESLQLDILKIDRSFVEAIGTRAPTSQVVGHIITMARAMGLRIIAEGVERQSQADFLLAQKVEYAQGWLFGRPAPFSAIIGMLDAQRQPRQMDNADVL